MIRITTFSIITFMPNNNVLIFHFIISEIHYSVNRFIFFIFICAYLAISSLIYTSIVFPTLIFCNIDFV